MKPGVKRPAQSNFIGGIADFLKSDQAFQVAWCRSLDLRTDPNRITILPASAKESGNTVTDLVKWMDRFSTDTYMYGDTGNIYKRTSASAYSLMRTVPTSHGNGMAYYGEDDYIYYTGDKTLGRYGPMSGTPTFVDDFLTAEGGTPLNTYSLDLEADSSQYASRADTASLSQTGNLTLEAYITPESLPAVGSTMTMIGKWDESGTLRSYIFDLKGIAGYFGDSSDGALTISADTTDTPTDSACTGTIATYTLSATNASFAAGQQILIHQTYGTGAGTWQKNKILTYTAGTITTTDPLNATYITGAQVLVLKQYTNVTINSGKTWTSKAWTGTVGGILAFLASGTVTVTGTITATERGFIGAVSAGAVTASSGQQGQGSGGLGGAQSTANVGNGGGGGLSGVANYGAVGGGGGGGNATAGGDGETINGKAGGFGGSTSGTADLTTMTFGGAGGTGGSEDGNNIAAGNGGGMVCVFGATITVAGAITANGKAMASLSTYTDNGLPGAGAGGSVLLKCTNASTLGTALITASGGTRATSTGTSTGNGGGRGGYGGAGGDGRIHIDYAASYTGTTSPTLNATLDSTLSVNTTYQTRLGVSSTGLNSEYLAKTITLTAAMKTHMAVSWVASTSIATFYQDGVSLGSVTGTFTAIHDNASAFYVGTNKGASAVGNFYDGLIDEVRVWGGTRTASEISGYKDRQLVGTEANLKAYYQFNNAATDTTGNANDLTLSNAPVYSTTVPFSAPTTRLDIDQQDTGSGNTTAILTAISEATSGRHLFVPSKDPQKSLSVNISAKGTNCDWTLTIHDALNRTIATATILNAALNTGACEFIFTTPWRPVIGATYHWHVTTTNITGAPAVVSTTAATLNDAQFTSYYQFVATDVDYHPIMRFTNFIAIGNERYLATWNASTYTFNRLRFPSGYRVRALGVWNEYMAIGCWKGTTIKDYDDGIIFFWDGYSVTYNFFIPVPQGAVNAMSGAPGELHIVAGYEGDILRYTGGVRAVKVKKIPKLETASYMEVMPGAMSMYKSLLRIGVAGTSDSSLVERGTYTWGHLTLSHPESLTYDYPISTGTRASSGVKVGCLMPYGGKLLSSWKDGTAYGVDVIDPAAAPYSSGTLELNTTDEGGVWKEKLGQVIRADVEPLISGQTITAKYKFNRAATWTQTASGTTNPQSTVGATNARLPIKNGRHFELQVAVDMTTSVTTSPALLSVAFESDQLNEEEKI